MFRSRLHEGHEVIDFLRLQRGVERRHIHTAVDDTDDHIAFPQLVGDEGEIRAAPVAVALNQMAVETGFLLKQSREWGWNTCRTVPKAGSMYPV